MDDSTGDTTEHATDDWTEKRNYPPASHWGAPQEPVESRYLGLTGAQFNIAFFVVLGAIALAALLFLGGASAVKDFVAGGDEPASQADVTQPAPDADNVAPAGGGEAVNAVLDTFNPFSLVGALGSQAGAPAPAGGGDDDALKAALLEDGDLPGGFSSFGEMSFSVPVSGGNGTMAANMFSKGDLASDEFSTMVMSAALEGPGLLDELGGLGELGALSDDEIAQMEQALGQFGIGFSDFRALDASGLGDGGVGMHLAMDFAGMFSQLGVPGGEAPPFDSIVWEMYVFEKGERVYMVMVMWPGGSDSGVDSRSLADAVDAKAG